MKTSPALTNAQIAALKAAGANRWKRGPMDRLYITIDAATVGLDVTYYGTGNVSSATLDGEHLSNSRATGMLGALAGTKIWVDVADGTFNVKRVDYSGRAGRILDRAETAAEELVAAALTAAATTPAAELIVIDEIAALEAECDATASAVEAADRALDYVASDDDPAWAIYDASRVANREASERLFAARRQAVAA